MKNLVVLSMFLFGAASVKAQEQVSPDKVAGGPRIPITFPGEFKGMSSSGSTTLIHCKTDPFSKCFTIYLPVFRSFNEDDEVAKIEIYSGEKVIQHFEVKSIKENTSGIYEFELK